MSVQDFEIKDQPAQPTLSMRFRTRVEDLPTHFGQVYGMIPAYLAELGEKPVPMAFAIYYNLDMQNMDVEAGFPLTHKLPGRGEIQASELPAGKYATCMNIGPYNQMEPTYDALAKWAIEKGYEPDGIAVEYYLSGPETPPEAVQTIVAFHLK